MSRYSSHQKENVSSHEVLRRTIDDTKPEKLDRYLRNIKRYVDTIAGHWTELSVMIMEQRAAYDAICAHLGLPAAVPAKDHEKWCVVLKARMVEMELRLRTSTPSHAVLDAFTHHLVKMNDIVETRRTD